MKKYICKWKPENFDFLNQYENSLCFLKLLIINY